MKIVFLHRFKGIGGAERQLIELAFGLSNRGHSVEIIAFYPIPGHEQAIRDAGIKVTLLNKRHRWDVLRFFWRMCSALRIARPDIVHGYLGMANALLVLTRPVHRARVVWGVRSSEMDLKRYGTLVRFDSWIESALSRYPALIVANSHAGKIAAERRGFREDKVVVIPNGVDIVKFRRDSEKADQLRRGWSLENTYIVGRIGRIDPQKDHETFLQAASIVLASMPMVHFAVIGGDEAGIVRLKRMADNLGISDRVVWEGPRVDLAGVYSALNCCVSSSSYGEGIPNVLLESFACETPVVATDVGDSANVVGQYGIVVPPRDPAALAKAIQESLWNPIAGVALRDHVTRRYSLDHLVSRTEQELLALIP